MRVLHVLHHSIPVLDGYSMRSEYILRTQQELGIAPLVVTGPQHEPYGEPLEAHNGIEYHRTPNSVSPGAPWFLRASPGRELAIVRSLRDRLLDIIARQPVDIIHAHSPSLIGLAALQAARRAGIPIVYEVRGFWEDALVDQKRLREGSPVYRLSRALETYLLQRVDAVIALCGGLRADMIARGVRAEKITIVPNGVDARALRPATGPIPVQERLGLRGHLVIGFIGSFYFFEGLQLLVENFPSIQNLCPGMRLKLLLVGRGEAEAPLKALAQRLGPSAQDVIFTGQVPHDTISDYYGVMDLLVYPRRRNRMTELVTPLKPLEAMALRRPVLASDVGGNRELIWDGETGCLFKADRGPSLVSRCVELLERPGVRTRLAAQAQAYVLQHRGWPQIIKRHLDVYKKISRPTGHVSISMV